MLSIIRLTSDSEDFISLANKLDAELNERYGAQQSSLDQYNIVQGSEKVLVAYIEGQPVGCGCFRKHDCDTVEIKRMYVAPANRGTGISKEILAELEKWALELEFSRSVLETGSKQPEALGLYGKSGYSRIDNYGPYSAMPNSLCFGKDLKHAKNDAQLPR